MKRENPTGLDGIDFVEFTHPEPEKIKVLFQKLGFRKTLQHKTKDISVFKQGDIHFVLNNTDGSYASEFRKRHGPSICGLGLRVLNAEKAVSHVKSKGAKLYTDDMVPAGFTTAPLPMIYGIGDSLIYLVENYRTGTVFDSDFQTVGDRINNAGYGFSRLDHLTNNVERGQMDQWVDFYQRLFGFFEIKYFDIKGKRTGLFSRAMGSPCGKFAIPINESQDEKSQIQEYINEYKGPGIQHLAFLTNDILTSVRSVHKEGIPFLDVPDTYYDMLPGRVPNVTENLGALKDLKILADGDEEGYLLQIFTTNTVGPIFFEVIQRKNHSGFGDGNFQALFDAMEQDQVRRGVLK